MSNKLLNEMWNRETDYPGDKLVLLRFADRADDNGVSWPGARGIARDTGLSKRHVKRVIRKYEKRGVLEPKGYSDLGTKRRRLRPENLPALPELDIAGSKDYELRNQVRETKRRGDVDTNEDIVTPLVATKDKQQPELESNGDLSTPQSEGAIVTEKPIAESVPERKRRLKAEANREYPQSLEDCTEPSFDQNRNCRNCGAPDTVHNGL